MVVMREGSLGVACWTHAFAFLLGLLASESAF